jgi:large subunit ribosomal protein L6
MFRNCVTTTHHVIKSSKSLYTLSIKKSKESRIGKKRIPIPDGDKLKLNGNSVEVEGPKGKQSLSIDDSLALSQDGNFLKLEKTNDERRTRQIHGLNRTLLYNLTIGVSNGFEKTLTLVGVGYRAKVDGRKLNLSVGFSHPVIVELPTGINVAVRQNTNLSVTGINKSEVCNFAAKLRKINPPEPYGGKGLRYTDEVIKLKEGKSGRK